MICEIAHRNVLQGVLAARAVNELTRSNLCMRVPSVLVRHEVCLRFDEVARSCENQPEKGGILLGNYRGNDLEIVDRTNPGPMDKGTLSSFVKVDPLHQSTAHDLWSKTGGTHTYVGEWHTHPFGLAEPSITDSRTWASLASKVTLPLIFVIAAPGHWVLFAVRPSRWRVNAARLSVVERGMTGLVFGVRDPTQIRIARPT